MYIRDLFRKEVAKREVPIHHFKVSIMSLYITCYFFVTIQCVDNLLEHFHEYAVSIPIFYL